MDSAALIFPTRDRTVNALKAAYVIAGLLPDESAALDVDCIEDIDCAYALTGEDVYVSAWHDGIHTDCIPHTDAYERLVLALRN